MNREEQIQKMARIIRAKRGTPCLGNCTPCVKCVPYMCAEILYNEDYRLQTEVVSEIFAKIDEMFSKDLQRYHAAIEPTDSEEIKRIFKSHIISAETYRKTIAELIREYTEANHGPKRTN